MVLDTVDSNKVALTRPLAQGVDRWREGTLAAMGRAAEQSGGPAVDSRDIRARFHYHYVDG